MKMRVLLVPLLGICLLGGCRKYSYYFQTIIAGDGSVVRTITFGYSPEEAEELPGDEEATEETGDGPESEAETGEAAEPAEPENESPPAELSAAEEVRLRGSLPDALVLPDRTRFESYDLSEHGLKATWRSQGLIHTDFRYVTPSYTESNDPVSGPTEAIHMPFTMRQAYNEGRVTVSDLGLVNTVNYFEKFHDFYTREEFDEYADTLIDIHARLFFDVVSDSFTAEYDVWDPEAYYVWGFYDVVIERGVPLVKRWKEYLYRAFVVGAPEPVEDPEAQQPGLVDIADLLTAEKLAMTHDLMQMGVVDDPHFDAALLLEKAREWVIDQMSTEIWKSHTGDEEQEADEEMLEDSEEDEEAEEDDDHEASSDVEVEELEVEEDDEDDMFLSISEIERFFEEDFAKLYNAHLELRYGSDEYFLKHLASIYRSFAEEGGHVFELTTTMPGHVVRVLPEPASIEQGDDGAVVRWIFEDRSFFPDGVLLSAISVVPNQEAQESLYGKVVLAEPQAMTRYVALMLQLPAEQRTYFLEGLQEAVEDGTLDEFVEDLRSEYPDGSIDGEPIVEPINELIELLEVLQE